MTKKVKRLLMIGAIIVVLLSGVGFYYYRRVANYQEAVQAILITEPNLTEIKDGTYIGEHDVDFIRAKVKVEVRDHRFQSIHMLEHHNDRGKKAERLPEKMLSQQKVTVDAVSGVTSSSKVIQKAGEKALLKE